ncbi:MAG: hypothetical protein ACREBQ_05065 [Nitrososphaerales archaeon]
MQEENGEKQFPSPSYLALITAILMAFGFGMVFLFPFPSNVVTSPPYETLLLAGLFSFIAGRAILVVSFTWFLYRGRTESSKRSKGTKTHRSMTRCDWVREFPLGGNEWFGLIPFIAILFLPRFLMTISVCAFVILFFGYGGFAFLWDTLLPEDGSESKTCPRVDSPFSKLSFRFEPNFKHRTVRPVRRGPEGALL